MLKDELLFYRESGDSWLLEDMCDLVAHIDDSDIQSEMREAKFYKVISGLYEFAGRNGYKGNLWHCYLTEFLVYNENSYTIACEMRGEVSGTLNQAVLHDFRIFKELFNLDFEHVEEVIGETKDLTLLKNYEVSGKGAIKYNKNIVNEINALAIRLDKAESVDDFKKELDVFYKEYGVGVFGLHKAFRVERKDAKLNINPIFNIAVTSLDDIVGYDIPKNKLIANTEAFLQGKKANNCLIYGDAGTGKSSSIRALLNQYYTKGLRMIEVYKHQYQELNDLIDSLKIRNYKFIIYLDDLSFEEFETEYKYLKAVIEGGLESKPDNVLIYATSNRRHLVKETMADKNGDDVHRNETNAEKLSLFARFGESIFFGAPEKKEFENIVLTLAHRYNIAMTDSELLMEANKWAVYHGKPSGRMARQFIDALRAKQ